jgi:hypothetical protein
MSRVLLIDWNAAEAARHTLDLREAGHEADFYSTVIGESSIAEDPGSPKTPSRGCDTN